MGTVSDRVGHSDRPLDNLEQDSLGLGPYAKGLAQFIRHCDTPFTVAVQGDWGTGKTSLMRMVDSLLSPTSDATAKITIDTVWFQTWQYSQFGSMAALPVSLLATLLQCLSGDPGKLEQAKQVMGRLIKPIANAALRVGTMGATELNDFDGVLARQAVDSATNANQLKNEIAELIKARLATGVDRIVIFIDDLDRIKPAIAVEILETIKLFVDWPGCVFVLALDYGVVSRGLKDKFGIGEQDLGRSFFDKIIQLPFTVPVARYTVDKYIDALFRDMALPMAEGDGELFADLVRHSVSVNPRGIKRVFNSLQLLINMADARQDRLAIRILFAVLCLQIGFEGIYNWLLLRGEGLSADDLLLLADVESDSRDDVLSAALGGIASERRKDWGQFAQVFLESVQDPARKHEEIDAEELVRIRQTLTLSRVTSVQTNSAPAAPVQDPEFLRRNRHLMTEIREKYDEALSDAGQPYATSWINTAHGSSSVWLRRSVGQGGILTLALVHAENEILLYIEGNKSKASPHLATLKRVLTSLASPWESTDEEAPLFLRRLIPSTASFADREVLLMKDIKPLYIQAYRALDKAL